MFVTHKVGSKYAGGGCYDSTGTYCVELFSGRNGVAALAAMQVKFAGPRNIVIMVNNSLLRLAKCMFSAQGYDVGGQGGRVYADEPPFEFPEASLQSAGLRRAPAGVFPSSTDAAFIELQVCPSISCSFALVALVPVWSWFAATIS
jgi:hypothetical protein